MTTPASTALKLLFPSWEFFDEATLPPTLQCRRFPCQGEPGSWIDVVQPPPRRWWNLLFNAKGTETLAAQSLVERWYTELIELGEHAPTYQQTLALVTALAEHAFAKHRHHTDDPWQLRLVVRDTDTNTIDVAYQSDRLTLRRTTTTP